ncbi:MAG: YkgJ family cysteine cluster protein [Flavobacteriales bacterium]|nr:YkgJ family cysteine cluster protein [Flavobacteriaceae bacterium]MDP4952546.1 YkgJ family cysteine cluster protein [Flavobacteriales bacterium]
MKDLSSICLSCGLCCDGTLIGFVHLDAEEVPEVRKYMEIEEEQGHGFFLHPCQRYCDGCTIYAHRPKQCGLFKCGLLKSVEQKELQFDLALEAIAELKELKLNIEERLSSMTFDLQSPSFYFRIIELKRRLLKLEQSASLSSKDHLLLATLQQFDVLLLEKFDLTID